MKGGQPDILAGMSPVEAAAYWRMRHDRGILSGPDAARFEHWIDADAAHAHAWRQAQGLWDLFDRPDDPHLDAMRAAALADGTPARSAFGTIRAGVAASLALALLALASDGGRGVSDMAETAQVAAAAQPRHYQTRRGERLNVVLPDETLLTLDTDTAVEVVFEDRRRTVRLTRGQALFEVAKDPRRPFTVEAGDRRVTALGTTFDVALNASAVAVMLVEGRVAVTDVRPPATGARTVVLRPGQALTAGHGGPARVRPVDIEGALLWRDGLISLEDVTLAHAVGQLNRYSSRPMTVRDPAIAGLRVSGVFRTGAPERFVASIAEVLPVAARPTRTGIEIVPDAHPEPAEAPI